MYISFLALGQAGGNIADEAAKRGYYSGALNFSQVDLDSLEHVQHKLKLVGSEGIGKERNNAIQLMANNWDLSINFVKENFSHPSIEIIFVPFSTGGGSGSGIAPVLLNMLSNEMPNKVFIAMPIIPDKTESYISQRNCIETFEDLSSFDGCILPIDNDKCLSMNISNGKNHLFKTVNKWVVDMIEKIESYTKKESNLGVLDKKDLRNIFDTKGMATISEVNLIKINELNSFDYKWVANKIQSSWNNGFFMDINKQEFIYKSGLIFDGQEILIDLIDIPTVYSTFENKPFSQYEGYYTSEDGRVFNILSGLSWNQKRLENIKENVLQMQSSFSSLDRKMSFQSNIEKVNPTHTKKKKVNDISDLIQKFKR